MKKIMLGNEAIARGAYEAGATVASSYPGTPSTEITENIAKYDEIYSEWSPNEKVSLEVVIGAAIAGARSITAMKHVGLNVAADPLFTVSYSGVNAGLVLAVADDPGMHSSQNEQDSRHYARSAKLPMLEPSDSQECKDFIKEAFEISENFDTPIIVRSSTRISHSCSIVELGEREEVELKDYKKDFEKYVMMPAMGRKRHPIIEKRMEDLKEFANKTELNKIYWGNKKIGVISSGIAYQYAREAFGNEISYLKLGMVYPLADDLIREFANEVDTLYVVEELEPFFENYIKAMGIEVIGKEKLPIVGELNAQIIRENMLDQKLNFDSPIKDHTPIRPPVMCPGCPHRGAFHILNKLGLVVTGDIGCYTLGAIPPTEAMDTCVCMGASVSMAHGMDKARGKEFAKKTIGVLGDSTFIHSGITGLIDIVYNKGISTIMILDNSITGMTGHQDNPTTGYTIKGEETVQVDLVKLSHAIGINRVVVADPFDLEEFERVVSEEVAAEEPSVIISQRPCALLDTADYSGIVEIDRDVCDYCQQCTSLGCPAIVDKDDHIEINEALCNGCTLCFEKCDFGIMTKAGEDNA
ncbi:indolepyruvate ferredoxin oxidoreductase subunit alpha [Natronospora cellulosivora (SeqCode)]